MNYFDASTWIGKWPFAFCDAHTARSLAAHLRRHGMARALVSPLAAVFAPEPGLANRELLQTTRGVSELEPVPVINPALANWREQLAEVAADRRVRAVRVLPSYHNYSVRGPEMSALAAELTKRRLRLAVQVRLIDERHEFHAMNLKPVSAADLAAFLRRNPRLPVLASGLLRPEVLKLAPRHPQLLADLTLVEWHDTLEHMLVKVPARQLAFASHTPLLITAASQAKVAASAAAVKVRAAVAASNLERLLGR